ncbi:type II secretion system protein GspM [Desulfovibrio inopinatus]|uniref:type II secretion system protein GspM n=1 Tax=Desulfovibrio inopinatus TaxID=102109 RepID=UPI0004032F05|nr:type II secretion system protein GspM [Desulfovibrio inopinatus]
MKQLHRTTLLYGLAGVVLILGFFEWVVAPIHSYQDDLVSRIAHSEKQLKEILSLEQTYTHNKGLLSKEATEAASENFTLFSFLEQAADRTGVRQHIESMRQSRGALSEGVDEESVDIRLSKVPLNTLVTFLYRVEKSSNGVYVKTMTLRPNSTEGMDGDLTISAPAKQVTGR